MLDGTGRGVVNCSVSSEDKRRAVPVRVFGDRARLLFFHHSIPTGRKVYDMLPVRLLRLQLGELLAADPTTLAPVTAINQMMLVKSVFVPDENLVLADLTPADFAGSTPLVIPDGAVPVGIDPATQEQVISIPPPAGGYRWEATSTLNLPQTIYGFAFFDGDTPRLLATALFPTPIAILGIGDTVEFGPADLRIVLQPMS